MTRIEKYIRDNIGKAVCYECEDTDQKYGLPYPYSVPTVGERFHSMYYWDTYFTNLGLIALGDIAQAKNNIDNMAYLVERLGYMPNGNAYRVANRSQPPFLGLMVRDILIFVDDIEWERKMYSVLSREHAFWISNRSAQNGLQHYGTDVPTELQEGYAKRFCDRVGIENLPEQRSILANSFLAQAESGWDFCARFELAGPDYCAVDLNALLWATETVLATLAKHIENGEENAWLKTAERRASLMREILLDENGVFRDRNAKTQKFSPVFSVASLFPLFVGMANKNEAENTVKMLPLLMHKHGVAPCERTDDGKNFQWGAPNGWPCLQAVTSTGLERYGYDEQAKDIGVNYINLVESVFDKTGALWEKYNLDTGTSDTINEYEMPEMLGWTAGTYLYFLRKYGNL